jgi:transcriptional regulator with XRE-family HTH domain
MAEVSTHYIGLLETSRKFPSAEMIHKLATALDIDPTELFAKDLDLVELDRRSQLNAWHKILSALSSVLNEFATTEIKKLESP